MASPATLRFRRTWPTTGVNLSPAAIGVNQPSARQIYPYICAVSATKRVRILLENFSLEEVQSAARDALRLGALSFDAVKHLVLYRLEGRPLRLDLELYPYLPRVRVNTTSARDYMPLLSGRAA